MDNDVTKKLITLLKDNVETKKYLDVSVGIEKWLGVSRTRFKNALSRLEKEGYTLTYIQIKHLETGKDKVIPVLTKCDVSYEELCKNKDQIKTIN